MITATLLYMAVSVSIYMDDDRPGDTVRQAGDCNISTRVRSRCSISCTALDWAGLVGLESKQRLCSLGEFYEYEACRRAQGI
jgi:hypothetical protein